MGRSIWRFSMAASRREFNQSVKHAWNTWGLSKVRTMRKTSLRGTPKGKGKPWRRNSCLARAHLAMAVGPLAPARIAMMEMTTTLVSGWRRLISQRGSSSVSKCLAMSASVVCCESVKAGPPCRSGEKLHEERYRKNAGKAQAPYFNKIAQSARWPWLEALPAYAPDLNPVAALWQPLKHVEMRNLVLLDVEELHQEFHLAVGRVRQKPHLVQSFFKGAGIPITK